MFGRSGLHRGRWYQIETLCQAEDERPVYTSGGGGGVGPLERDCKLRAVNPMFLWSPEPSTIGNKCGVWAESLKVGA